jgi:hypothetical protein
MDDRQRQSLAGVAAFFGLGAIASGVYEAYERHLPLADGFLVGLFRFGILVGIFASLFAADYWWRMRKNTAAK